MTWLLDTNIVSELTKPQPDPTCEMWLDAHAADCAISAITLSELRFGIERLPDGRKKKERNRDFEFLVEDYHGRFFDFDAPSAFEWGRYAAELEGGLRGGGGGEGGWFFFRSVRRGAVALHVVW